MTEFYFLGELSL